LQQLLRINSPEVKKYKMDKKPLVISILKEVFNLNDEEVKFIDIQIEDSIENKLIKSIPLFYKFGKIFFKVFKKSYINKILMKNCVENSIIFLLKHYSIDKLFIYVVIIGMMIL